MYILNILFILCYLFSYTNCQENTENQVAPSLQECYTDPDLVSRNNRLPSSIPILIELIRKIENSPSFSMDMRQLSKTIVHRFKQDGILRANVQGITPGILPYSPVGIQFRKHQIIMKKLIPGDSSQFDNESLNALERCSLHFMISNTQQMEVFENDFPCRRTAYYRRYTRDLLRKRVSNTLDDIYDSSEHLLKKKRDVSDEIATFNTDTNDGKIGCIVEGGVIFTQWGQVSIGAVISGIAAGLSPQSPSVNQLKNDRESKSNLQVDNIWATTFSGDLTEVSLKQGEKLSLGKINKFVVGGNGMWNSTSAHRWYFLSSEEKIELTDAEIRGDLDGLILGTNINKWVNDNSNLKLSQVLDMYYSPRGVFDKKYRACNRNSLFTEVAPTDKLRDQTQAFTEVSEPNVLLYVTVNTTTLKTWTTKAVDELRSYLPTLVDVACREQENIGNENVNVAVDLVIAVDHTWPYKDIEFILSYIVEQIDVNMYASNITVISAVNGRTIVNATNTLLDFYNQFNETVYKNLEKRSFDMDRTLNAIKFLTMDKLDYEKKVNAIEGKSQMALLVIYSSESIPYESVQEQIKYMDEKTPDLRILYAVQNNKNRFDNISKNAWIDTFLISSKEDMTELDKLVDQLKLYPRRITNPSCGSMWESDREGNHKLIQYINTNSVAYYKMSPNYFYKPGNYKIKIQSNQASQLTYCYSRTTSPIIQDNECKTITSEQTIELDNPCSNARYIHECEPLFIIIKAPEVNAYGSSCNVKSCRFPDSIHYSISTENLVCQSKGHSFQVASMVLIFTFIIYFIQIII